MHWIGDVEQKKEKKMNKKIVCAAIGLFALMATYTVADTLMIGGSSTLRDYGWGDAFVDWQQDPSAGHSLTNTIPLGEGVEVSFLLETAEGWQVTCDQAGAGVKTGLVNDDDDRLDGLEWLELSVLGINDPSGNLTSFTASELNIGYINETVSNEQVFVSDGTTTVASGADVGTWLARYGAGEDLETLTPLSLGNIGTWKVRVTADPEGANTRWNHVIFDYTIIPEPGTLSLVALVGGGMLFFRRRFGKK